VLLVVEEDGQRPDRREGAVQTAIETIEARVLRSRLESVEAELRKLERG
jgi:hypothetical protein